MKVMRKLDTRRKAVIAAYLATMEFFKKGKLLLRSVDDYPDKIVITFKKVDGCQPCLDIASEYEKFLILDVRQRRRGEG